MTIDAVSIVQQAANGDTDAANQLLPLVYDELRRLAGHLVGGEGEVILQPTALVHEAYLKLIGAADLDWKSQTHFYAIAARAMGQVVCDNARGRGRAKRGGGWNRVTLSGIEHAPDSLGIVDASQLHEALEELRQCDDRAATVVILRFFGGLGNNDIAAVLGVTDRTIRNDWNMARAWLHCKLTHDTPTDA